MKYKYNGKWQDLTGGSNSGNTPTPIEPIDATLVSISAEKTKIKYNVDEEILLDDLKVKATFSDSSTQYVTNYTTNVDELNTLTDGLRLLKIAYTCYGITKQTTVPINVMFTNTSDNVQYAFCVNRNGLIENGKGIFTLKNKLIKTSTVNIRYLVKFTVMRNNSKTNVKIGLGNKDIWGTNTINDIVITPNQVGEFLLEANVELPLNTSNNLTPSTTPYLLNLYTDDKNNIEGIYEILQYSISVTDKADIVIEELKATKDKTMFMSYETINSNDIDVTVTYTDDTTKKVTNWESNINELSAYGDVPLTITYTENAVTKQVSINLKVFKPDLASPMRFKDETCWEVCNKIGVGYNLGNQLDNYRKYGAEYHGEDVDVYQETAWNQPMVTQESLNIIHDFGFNTIRIPATWSCNGYRDENGDLRVGKYFKSRVREVVDYAYNAGFDYIILNSHWDSASNLTDVPIRAGVSDSDFQDALNNTRTIWEDICEKFKNYDHKLIFEGASNELYSVDGNNYERGCEQINQLNQMFVDTVRASGGNNAKRILMSQPNVVNGSTALKLFEVPRDTVSDKFICQVHQYTKLYIQDIDVIFSQYEKWVDERNCPIVIGEFGSQYSEMESKLRPIHALNYVSRAKYHGVKCMWWDNGSSYALYVRPNPTNTKFDVPKCPQSEMNAIVNALIEGGKGEKCYAIPSNKLKTFDKKEDFGWGIPDGLNTTYYNYWGALTTLPIECEAGDTVNIVVNVEGEASTYKFYPKHYYFYDEGGNQISSGLGTYGVLTKVITAPSNAKYVRATVLEPHESIKQDVFYNYLENGLLSVNVSSFKFSDISKVNLAERTIDNIILNKNKRLFNVGEVINTNDIYLACVFNDGYIKTVKNFTTNVDEINTSSEGVKTLTATCNYNGVNYSKDIEIQVGEAEMESLIATLLVNRLNVGDTLNSNNLSVKAKYTTGIESEIDDYVLSPSSLVVGTNHVTVSYNNGINEVSTAIDVTVAGIYSAELYQNATTDITALNNPYQSGVFTKEEYPYAVVVYNGVYAGVVSKKPIYVALNGRVVNYVVSYDEGDSINFTTSSLSSISNNKKIQVTQSLGTKLYPNNYCVIKGEYNNDSTRFFTSHDLYSWDSEKYPPL